MCEIVGKRFIKFWAHPNFIYRWTGLYKIQAEHCEIIGKLTGRVRIKLAKLHINFHGLRNISFRFAMRKKKNISSIIKIRSPNSNTQSMRIPKNHINHRKYWSINCFDCSTLENSPNKWWKSKSKRSLLLATKRRPSQSRIRFYCWQCIRKSRIGYSRSCKVYTIHPTNIHHTNVFKNWLIWIGCWKRGCECFPWHRSLCDAASPIPNWVRARYRRMPSSWWVYSICIDVKIFGARMRTNSIQIIFRRNDQLDEIRSVFSRSVEVHGIASVCLASKINYFSSWQKNLSIYCVWFNSQVYNTQWFQWKWLWLEFCVNINSPPIWSSPI